MLPREAPVRRWPAEPAAGPLTRTSIALALAAVALAIAACGSDAGETTSPASEGAIDLTVTLDGDGDGGEPPATEAVSCSPPDCPAGAAELTAADFAPVAPDVACTEIYGGPDTVTVEGTLDGEPVEAQLTRANGCEIDRFDRFGELIAGLFPDYEPGASIQP